MGLIPRIVQFPELVARRGQANALNDLGASSDAELTVVSDYFTTVTSDITGDMTSLSASITSISAQVNILNAKFPITGFADTIGLSANNAAFSVPSSGVGTSASGLTWDVSAAPGTEVIGFGQTKVLCDPLGWLNIIVAGERVSIPYYKSSF